MPTQGYNNRQGSTVFVIPADPTPIDVLATGGVQNDYQEGMSTNGGNFLNLEVNNTSATDVALVGYRRVTTETGNSSPWSVFFRATAPSGTPYTQKIPGIGGFSAVRITAVGAGVALQTIEVSATITQL